MNILGIVAHTLGYGDASATLSVDGKIIGIVEEERFSRIRYDDGFPGKAINYLLKKGGIPGTKIDIVALHLHPLRGISKRLPWVLRNPHYTLINSGDYLRYYLRYGNLYRKLVDHLGSNSFEIKYYGHHLCHAAAAFYTSSFEHAAFLSLDGAGEGLVGSIGIASRKEGVRILRKFIYPFSLGIFYSAICDYIGFPAPAGPGKVMALAAYGDTKKFMPLFRKLIQVREDSLWLDLDFFLFHKNLATPISDKPWMSKKFTNSVGVKRRKKDEKLLGIHIDLAAALQERTNEIGIELSRLAAKLTNETNLCLGGGVALNSVMNGAIFRDLSFKNIHIQPAAGDAGNSLGAVYLAALEVESRMPHFEGMPFTGPSFNDEEIETEFKNYNLTYRLSSDIALEAARAIKDGFIVGWFQGGMEFGPRALGARSILADPQHPEMKGIINGYVKYREWFRPYAPSVTSEACNRYFMEPKDNPYMLIVTSVREEWRKIFPSITHIDGSARVQSVSKETNPLFHRLLEYLGQIHKHPVVLNTSFNVKAPIVCTPEDAIKCFLNTQIDILCIGNFIVRKDNNGITI